MEVDFAVGVAPPVFELEAVFDGDFGFFDKEAFVRGEVGHGRGGDHFNMNCGFGLSEQIVDYY